MILTNYGGNESMYKSEGLLLSLKGVRCLFLSRLKKYKLYVNVYNIIFVLYHCIYDITWMFICCLHLEDDI